MHRYLTLLLVSLSAMAAAQDSPGVVKYRNYTPQQIANLPQEQRSAEVPMTYIFATRNGMGEGSEVLFAMYLNSLMYPGVSDYSAAVKQYQRDVGDKPNGVLTVYQISQLEQRAGMQKLAEVLFPSQYSNRKMNTYAKVTGTFVILDDKIAYPINYTEVTCFKSEGYCRLEQLFLTVPNEKSWSQNYHVQQFGTEYFNITNWTEDSIDAAPDESTGACRATTMNLNFATEEFYQITRNTGRECEVMGEVMPKLEAPRISQIVDGEKIIAQEFADVKKAAFDVLSSDFRAKLEKLMAEEGDGE